MINEILYKIFYMNKLHIPKYFIDELEDEKDVLVLCAIDNFEILNYLKS